MPSNFAEPGSDGDLAPSVSIWKKGIVLTRRASPAGSDAACRVSVAFKRGVSPAHPVKGFHDLYSRVRSIGTRRIADLAAENPNLSRDSSIVVHGWQLLGDGGQPVSLEEGGKIATAFITLSVGHAANEPALHQPSFDDLRTPGGSSLEDLIRAEPQRAAEIYNEFDFSDGPGDLVTVSYGEPLGPDADRALDFAPSVDKAENFARSYHATLSSLGEVQSPFRIARREWFLASPRFATVHICFPK